MMDELLVEQPKTSVKVDNTQVNGFPNWFHGSDAGDYKGDGDSRFLKHPNVQERLVRHNIDTASSQ